HRLSRQLSSRTKTSWAEYLSFARILALPHLGALKNRGAVSSKDIGPEPTAIIIAARETQGSVPWENNMPGVGYLRYE
ncbi:hypothetical protein, partial [Mesorhizobium sp. M00.F.Ca.ET.216.01.1.1]|uniref:hypothetical protein n=1 Tax=Mesorhizobium sp. M00.F.Ca.ET.216.01.1.1 TaxID=2500528 RepID=UPI001AEE427B